MINRGVGIYLWKFYAFLQEALVQVRFTVGKVPGNPYATGLGLLRKPPKTRLLVHRSFRFLYGTASNCANPQDKVDLKSEIKFAKRKKKDLFE